MKKKQIRFAIGEKSNQLSPIWKIWNQKNDVYLSGKFTGGAFKISLHESDVWTVAASTESGIELKPGNRRMKSWKRPNEFKKGWTFGPFIGVPRISSVDHLIIKEEQSKEVEWIPVPSENTKATIIVIFAEPKLSLEDLKKLCGKHEICFDSYLELNNKQKVFLKVTYERLMQSDYTNIAYLESEAKPWIDLNNNDIKGFIALFMQGAEVPYVYILKFGSSPNKL